MAFLSSVWALSYKFYHFPASDVKVYYGQIGPYKYIKYIGQITENNQLKRYDFSEVYKRLAQARYVSFFRYSYFWKNTFSQFKDSQVDFSYLDNKVLTYPVVGIGIKSKLLLFVPKSLIKNFSKSDYIGEDFRVLKWRDFYVFIKYDIDFDIIFDIKKYIAVLNALKGQSISLFTFQLGQNPYAKIKVSDFSDYILWLEVKKSNKLIGIILDMWPRYDFGIEYSQDFVKDALMLNKLRELYDAIQKFYKMMGALPQDIGSLYPNFYDITLLNKYWYPVDYTPLWPNRYKICFKPRSEEFKKLFWFGIDTNGYRCETYEVF
jgi:hypothetical protein